MPDQFLVIYIAYYLDLGLKRIPKRHILFFSIWHILVFLKVISGVGFVLSLESEQSKRLTTDCLYFAIYKINVGMTYIIILGAYFQ
jgi:hypothetical protein